MAVSSTRRVTNSTPSVRPMKGHSASSEAGGFVEAIDASNRVAVQVNLKDERKNKKQDQEEIIEEKEIKADLAYVRSAIEALAASGVYDENENQAGNVHHTSSRVNVYGNNQTIINRKEEREYPVDDIEESFFEKSNEDFDELV